LHDVELPQLTQYPFYNTGSKLAHNTKWLNTKMI